MSEAGVMIKSRSELSCYESAFFFHSCSRIIELIPDNPNGVTLAAALAAVGYAWPDRYNKDRVIGPVKKEAIINVQSQKEIKEPLALTVELSAAAGIGYCDDSHV